MVRAFNTLRGCVLVFVCLLSTASCSFYLPFSEPEYYQESQDVPAYVNKLSSVSALSLEYYNYPFCKPSSLSSRTRNLGQVLNGDKFESSVYSFQALRNETCVRVCNTTFADGQLAKLIDSKYRVQMVVDDLPVGQASTYVDTSGATTRVYDMGFPVGAQFDTKMVFNHIIFKVHYNKDEKGVTIVGIETIPESYKVPLNGDWKDICESNQFSYEANLNGELTFSYSVFWEEDTSVTWSHRWNLYFPPSDPALHWYSITYSLIVAIGCGGFITFILYRILRANLSRNGQISLQVPLEESEEAGWKTLHGDVFRAPNRFMMLAVLTGSGAQLLATFVLVLLFGAIGFLSPANPGSLSIAIVVFYLLSGIVAGYSSARVYMLLGGTRQRRNAVMTAGFFPGVIFSLFFLAQIALWSQRSTAGIPFGVLVGLIALFLFLMAPLVFVGNFLAFRRPVGNFPVNTNQIPRMVPTVPWYLRTISLAVVLGVLPFGAVLNELFFILNAMWSHRIFYLFGAVLVVFILFVLIIAEVAVLLCYFQLSNENYHWWWCTFLAPAVATSYIFIYEMFLVGVRFTLQAGAPQFVYLCYSLIMVLVLFVLMGSTSFLVCLTFVRKIYSTLHVD